MKKQGKFVDIHIIIRIILDRPLIRPYSNTRNVWNQSNCVEDKYLSFPTKEQISVYRSVGWLHWRGSAHGFPLGGSCHKNGFSEPFL